VISLKSLLKNLKEAQIAIPKKGMETPLHAKVQIPGYGVMTRKQLQKSIQRFVNEVSKYVRMGDAEKAHSALYNRNVLKGFLETEIKHSGK
jgi:hypothetical protein|tara:strand:+ start:48 stop:320 length:273 start_codon:yes stop_codon:yes gene_type:complete